MLDYILTALFTIIIFGIVIRTTQGRSSRKTHIIKKLQYITGYLAALLIGYLLTKIGIHFVLPLVMFAGFFIAYKYSQQTVKRFHDLGYSGWYLLATLIPFVSIYFFVLLYFRKGEEGINEYDQSIDYEKIMKKSLELQEKNLIEKYDNTYTINGFTFVLSRKNEQYKLKCPKAAFDTEFKNKDFFLANFSKTDGISYEERSYYFFETDPQSFEKIPRELGAIFIDETYLQYQGKELFIRDEGSQYEILMKKGEILPDEEHYIKKPNNLHTQYLLTREQLVSLMADSAWHV